MIEMTHLEPVLHSNTLIPIEGDDRDAVLKAIEDDEPEHVAGFLSKTGRVLGYRMADKRTVLYEGEIEITYVDNLKYLPGKHVDGWKPTGEPRVWFSTETKDAGIWAEAKRLFLAHSIRTKSIELFAGYRDRFVAVVPEEVGMKETKTFRSLADGTIESRHNYNVLDAVAQYGAWVQDLAMEFGGGDFHERAEIAEEDMAHRHGIQAWLMREAAEVQLDQARHSLKFFLAGQTMMAKTGAVDFNLSAFARALHADRSNLAKLAKGSPEINAKLREIANMP